MLQAISLAVAPAPHQANQEPPSVNTAGSEDRAEDMGSTTDTSAALAGPSWKPDSAEGGHHTLSAQHTLPPPHTRLVGATPPVTAAAATAPVSVRSAVAAQVGSLQEQLSPARMPPVSGDVLQPSSAGEDVYATARESEESKVSPSSGSSPKNWSDATAENGASAESSGESTSPLTSATNGTRDDSGPWKFGQSARLNSSTGEGEASGSKVTNPIRHATWYFVIQRHGYGGMVYFVLRCMGYFVLR